MLRHKTAILTMMEMADSSPTNGLHSDLPHLLVLPEELKKSLVAFLTAHDIASLVQTCKMVSPRLALR
jgi:hypothetical protein